ncbi:MAG: hypothetical protein ACREFK_03430 [Stellaceae bacterium]
MAVFSLIVAVPWPLVVTAGTSAAPLNFAVYVTIRAEAIPEVQASTRRPKSGADNGRMLIPPESWREQPM